MRPLLERPERYITTSIFYPNGNPHLGHALELVQADFSKRYLELFTERTTRLQIGLDEHGLKMQRAAADAGLEPQAYVNGMKEIFVGLADQLSIQYDRFIRTTDPDHIALAQAFWRLCAAKGDIYKKTYRAWYDVKEEEFLAMADDVTDPSVFGVDPKFLELIEEENYFFAASKYQKQVLEMIKSEHYNVLPRNRATELIRFVEEKGLQDVSISRNKAKLSWGIPVPGDDSQVMYVWFDALTNYLTGACSLNDGAIVPDSYWPANVHMVGKDIARFHGLLWPAMLLSAGLEIPLNLYVHGFVLSGGRKMSKSLGNGVEPLHIIEKYGADALRWYLLSEIPTLDDGDFTEARFGEIYTSTLANEYGNLVSRVVAMNRKYNEGRVPDVTMEMTDNAERAVLQEVVQEYHSMVIDVRYDAALAAVRRLMIFCNKRIDEHKPWELAKDESKRADLMELLYELLEMIRIMSVLLLPAIPTTAERVLTEVFVNASRSLEWGGLVPNQELTSESFILFPRIEHD